jgi:hypothetical protein
MFLEAHPYSGIELPEHTQELVKVTKEFSYS